MSVPAWQPSSDAVCGCVLKRPRIRTVDWAVAKIRKLPDSKVKTYEPTLFPHCIEPLNCFDDPEIRFITLQWAAQLGKTQGVAFPAIAKVGATDPHPMAWADADEKATRRVIRRLWEFFESVDDLAALCPPSAKQSSSFMELLTFLVHGAWPKAASSAADYGAFIVILNEADKMLQFSTRMEADFRDAMKDRMFGYRGAKCLEMSTPSVKGHSYIELRRLAGDNRRRLVPCPHCNHFQELRTGNGRDPGGVKFDKIKTPDGDRLDARLARESAWYECEKCRKRIEEKHRFAMLNSGLWVPEGCHVRRGKITGKPARPGNHASFGPLGSLHSLLPDSSIGTYAEKFVQSLQPGEDYVERRRNFVNSWEGETYDRSPTTVQPSDIEIRMGIDEPLGVCPLWSVFLTEGDDVGQIGEDLIFYWWVSAWGPHGRGQLVDFGISWSEKEYFDGAQDSRGFKNRLYPHADGGAPLRPIRIGQDSSNFTSDIYALSRTIPGAWPVKGDSEKQKAGWLTPSVQGVGRSPEEMRARRQVGNYDLIIMHTHTSQDWVESRLTGRTKRDHPDWYSIPLEALQGEIVPGVDLKSHLLGDYRTPRGTWEKRYEAQDFRDAFRISRVMASFYMRNDQDFKNLAPRTNKLKLPTTKTIDPAFLTRFPEI